MSDPFQLGTNTGAYHLTGEEAFREILQKLIGSVLPGAEGFAPLIQPFIMRQLGIYNSPELGRTLFTNMSPAGGYYAQQRKIGDEIGLRTVDAIATNRKQTFMEGIARTLTSRQSYIDAHKNALGYSNEAEITAAYNRFIDQETRGYMNNGLYSMLYKFADPMKTGMMQKYAGIATSNMIRHQLVRGNNLAFSQASDVMKELFNGEQFSKSEYGQFNEGGVAALTAALTKENDFLKDVGRDSSADSGRLKQVATDLRKRVKEYAEALSPLKDLFGDDVPAMLKTMEQMSGQSLSQMGVDRAKHLSMELMARTASGKYSIEDVSGLSQLMSGQLQRMNVSTLNKLRGSEFAMQALDMTYGGPMLRNFTKQDIANTMAKTVMSTANSSAAEAIDLAYSIWRTKKQKGTIEQFEQEMDKLGGDPATAAMKLAGVGNMLELQAGYNNEDFLREAKKSGLSIRKGQEGQLRNLETAAKHSMYYNSSVGGTAKQRADIFDRLTKLIKDGNGIGLFNMDDEGKLEFLNQNGFSEEEEAEIARNIVSQLNTQDKYAGFVKQLGGFASAKEARKAADTYKRRSEYLQTLSKDINANQAGSLGEAITNILTGSAEGLTGDSVEKYWKKMAELGMTEEDKKYLSAVMEAAAIEAKEKYGDTINTEEGKKQAKWLINNRVQSAVSPSMRANSGYSKAVKRFAEATEEGVKKAAYTDIQMYSNIDQDSLDSFLENHKDEGGATSDEMRTTLRGLYEKGGADAVNAYMTNTTVLETLRESEPYGGVLGRAWLSALWQAAGSPRGHSTEFLSKRFKVEDLEKTAAFKQLTTDQRKTLLSVYEESANGKQTIDQQMVKVLSDLTGTLNPLNKVLSALLTGQSNGAESETEKSGNGINKNDGSGE